MVYTILITSTACTILEINNVECNNTTTTLLLWPTAMQVHSFHAVYTQDIVLSMFSTKFIARQGA